jgi:hypothetical protein
VKRQDQRQEAIGRQRKMPSVGKRHVDVIAGFGEPLDPIRREGGIGNQAGQHRCKVAPFAIDFHTEVQFEPIDSATLELGVEGPGKGRQPVWKIIIDADIETL